MFWSSLYETVKQHNPMALKTYLNGLISSGLRL